MNLQELNDLIQRELEICKMNHTDPASLIVGIEIQSVKAIGGTPITTINRIQQGFDWDSNKLLLHPEKDLMLANHDHLAQMRKEAEEIGYTAQNVRDLKRQIKKMTEEFKRIDGLCQNML